MDNLFWLKYSCKIKLKGQYLGIYPLNEFLARVSQKKILIIEEI